MAELVSPADRGQRGPGGAGFIQALLAPRSIALIGASDDSSRPASRPLRFLRAAGYPGACYPVNVRGGTVAGERAYRSVLDLPEPPDHAFVLVGHAAVADVIAQCAQAGVTVATVLSGGFGEAGPTGVVRQRALTEIARVGGVRLLGPNSLGVVNFGNGLRLTANSVFGEDDFVSGGTFIASQSGSLIGSLVSRGRAKGLGFAAAVSVGGEADLSIGEICDATIDEPRVTGYALFLETIRHGRALAEFARRAAAAEKPVVAYKVGRSRVAAELAVSHTGAMVSEDDLAGQFLAQCGIARVETLDGLLEAPRLLARLPIRAPGRRKPAIGVVTTTMGGAAMVVDQLGVRGVQVQKPGVQTYRCLAAAGIEVARSRVIDLTLAGARSDVMRNALDVLVKSPKFDLIVAVVGSSARLEPERAVAPIIEVAGTGRLLAAFLVPEAPEALRRLNDADVAAFRLPETCADVLAAALSRRRPVRRPWLFDNEHGCDHAEAGLLLDEAASYEMLGAAGLPIAAYAVIDVTDGNLAAQVPFDYPVVVKVLDAEIVHKTDAGGVVLDVPGPTDLPAAVRTIADAMSRTHPDRPLSRILVQRLTRGLGEVLLGYRRDPQVGPIVVVSVGGTAVDLQRDRAVRLAPIGIAMAREMLGEVAAVRVLGGYRAGPRGDIDALAAALVRLSRLARQPQILEAEINPMMVHRSGAGVHAVDALVRLRGKSVLPSAT